MAMVRFATLCDRCKSRSEEYTAWPECKICMEHICPNCDLEHQRVDNEGVKTTLCRSEVCVTENALNEYQAYYEAKIKTKVSTA